MADFCRDCTIEFFGEELANRNDLVSSTLGEDEMVSAICEGCGPGYFDRLGRRLEWNEENEMYEYSKAVER